MDLGKGCFKAYEDEALVLYPSYMGTKARLLISLVQFSASASQMLNNIHLSFSPISPENDRDTPHWSSEMSICIIARCLSFASWASLQYLPANVSSQAPRALHLNHH